MEGKKRKGNQSSDGRGEKEKKKTLEGSSPEREQGGECEFCVVRTEISAGCAWDWTCRSLVGVARCLDNTFLTLLPLRVVSGEW